MDTRSLNEDLRALYESYWDDLLAVIPARHGYSAPYLLHASPSYARADIRLMVIGQQTKDWWGPNGFDDLAHRDPIPYLMETYARFELGADYKSVFWQAVHQLQERLSVDGAECGLMASNLLRVDWNGGRPERIENRLCQIPLLRDEIHVLKPDVVVFFTGPKYDGCLAVSFPGLSIEGIWPDPRRNILRVRAEGLPRCSYRTYHPKHLRLEKLTEYALTGIVQDFRLEQEVAKAVATHLTSQLPAQTA